MNQITQILMLMVLAGCQTSPPVARVFDDPKHTYHGKGLYLWALPLTTTNFPNEFAMELLVNNGYTGPVFVNADEHLIFESAQIEVVCYDENGTVLVRGELLEPLWSTSRCHPEQYVRIGEGGSVRNGQMSFGCCTMTEFTFHHPLNFNLFSPADGIWRMDPQDIVAKTRKMDVTVPLHIEYCIAGDERVYTCNTNVTVTVNRKENSSQPTDTASPTHGQPGD